MALSSDVVKIQYSGDGATTTFPYPYRIFEASDMTVYVDNVLQGSGTYTVTGAGNTNGGTVVFNTAPVSLTNITLLSNVPVTQTIDYGEGDKFPAETHELGLDRITRQNQEQKEKLSRSVQWGVDVDTDVIGNELPNPVANSGKVLGLSPTGITTIEVQATDFVNPLTNKGDLVTHDGTTHVAKGVGSNGQVLTADSGQTTGNDWKNIGTVLDNLTTTRGDLIRRGASTTERLAIGTTLKFLRSDSVDASWSNPYAQGNCRLVLDGSNLRLNRCDGKYITVWNGGADFPTIEIPAAGVALGTGGLAANTTYYIYAYNNSGNVALEASTTGHVQDINFGWEVKNGDGSRLLVGLARTNGSTAWVDTDGERFVLSYYHQRVLTSSTAFAVPRATTSSSYAEISSELRSEFLTWGTSAIRATSSGIWSTSAGATAAAGLRVDSTSGIPNGSIVKTNSTSLRPCACDYQSVLTEGYHYITLLGQIGSGTLTFDSGAADAQTRLYVSLDG